jgi:Lhr-like helicase
MNYHHMSNEKMVEAVENQLKNMRLLRGIVSACVILFFALVLMAKVWTPITGPWKQQRIGMANFRQAQQERRIIVEKARGELAAAADQASAIRTMGEAARDFPEYRTQQFIQAFSEALSTGKIAEIIYVPIEANLPITEAGKRGE